MIKFFFHFYPRYQHFFFKMTCQAVRGKKHNLKHTGSGKSSLAQNLGSGSFQHTVFLRKLSYEVLFLNRKKVNLFYRYILTKCCQFSLQGLSLKQALMFQLTKTLLVCDITFIRTACIHKMQRMWLIHDGWMKNFKYILFISVYAKLPFLITYKADNYKD